MTYSLRSLVSLALLIGFQPFCLADAPRPPQYAITDLGAIDDNNYHVFGGEGPNAVNNEGEIVGTLHGKAVLWKNDQVIELGAFATGWGDDELPGESTSIAYAINDHSEIVGASGGFQPIVMSGLHDCYPFLYSQGQFRNLARTGDVESFEPFGINDRGEIVGLHGYRGFYSSQGKIMTLGTLSKKPAGNRSRATAINRRGQFVGDTTINALGATELPVHAFLWTGPNKTGRMQDLGTLPGEKSSIATGINNQGAVVGYTTTNPDQEVVLPFHAHFAFLWQRGRMTKLAPLLGDVVSQARAINDQSQIVGTSKEGGQAASAHAVLWQHGRVYDLNHCLLLQSGWMLMEARAINNHGWIVGNGAYAPPGGQPPVLHAFLLKPK